MANQQLVTIVIPVHNEARNITPLLESIIENVSGISMFSFEVLFVDDGSTDDTLLRIKESMQRNIPTGYLKLSRNFGHQAALEAGIHHAAGDVVITMDGDLQHPAEMIPQMMAEYANGADIVQMQRANIKSDSKGIVSVSFYSFFSWVSNAPIVANAADFRLMSRRVVDEIKKFKGRGKLLRAIIPALGFKQVLIPYIQPERKFEKPKYTFFSSYELALHTLFKFSTFPANFLTLGSIVFFFITLTLIVLSLTGVMTWNHVSLSLIRTGFLAALIMGSAGIICWYLYFILEQVRSEPSYIVSASVPPGHVQKHE